MSGLFTPNKEKDKAFSLSDLGYTVRTTGSDNFLKNLPGNQKGGVKQKPS